MDYKQRESVNELKAFLAKARKSPWTQYKDSQALEADVSWNASYFFSQLISNATPSKYFWNLEKTIEFKKEYEKQHGISIDFDKLISKHWLRVILGFLEIPGLIRSAAYDYGKYKDYHKELSFLIQLKNKFGEKEVAQDDFQKAIKDFEKKHSHKINKECMSKNHWIKEEQDKVSISNVKFYQPLIDSWEEFGFIYALKEVKDNQEAKGILITKGNVNRIHSAHKKYFANTPELDEFTTQDVLKTQGRGYVLNFYNVKPDYWSALKDKISGLIWETLINDNSLGSDKERLEIWIEKVLYWSAWPNIFSHLTSESQKRYLDAALNLVLGDSDLADMDSEFPKMRLDDRHHGGINFIDNPLALEEESLDNQNYFELLHSMNELDDKYQSNLLRVQEVRENMDYLLKSIVLGDYEYETIEDDSGDKITYHYQRIKQLLKSGINKPFLLWETCHFIVQNKPEIIPYLLIEKDFASLSINLTDQVSFSDEIQDFHRTFRLKAWTSSLKLALDTMLPRSSFDDKEAALWVFQIFRQLNKDKYRVLSSYKSQKQQYDFRIENSEKEIKILELIENYPRHGYNVGHGIPNYFVPIILPHLFDLFKSFAPRPKFRNGTIQFPMMQWDGLTWLLKCSSYNKYKEQLENHPLPEDEIAEVFLTLYLDKIEQETVKKINYENKKEEDGRPLWSEKIERLELIDWIYPIYFINKTGKLNEFLAPRFKFKKTNNRYDQSNRFNAEKLRTHIGVLLQVLKKFSSPASLNTFDEDSLRKIQLRIESQIVDYVRKYGNSQSSNGIDIFDYRLEKQFQSSPKEELLPQLAQAINWFSNREEIVNALADSGGLVRMLTIADWITSEGVKKVFISKIKEVKIKEFLESHYMPEIQLAMFNLIEYPELIDQAEKVLDYWEKNIHPSNRVEYERAAYQVKLILAYKIKDENALDNIQAPKSTLISPSEFTTEDSRQFYRGLIRFDSKPEEAYQIFKNLQQRFSENVTLALNGFAAKITWGSKESNPNLYQEALDEWNNFEQRMDQVDLDSIQDKVWVNKLTAFHNLKEHEKVEKLYLSLEKPYRMLPAILSIWVESLLESKLDQEARHLLKEAEGYHKFSDGTEPEFLSNLKKKVDGEDYIQTLQNNYHEIFSSETTTLIKVLPPRLNGKKELSEFLTKEIAIACDKMLDKVLAVNTINDEDKYNDIIQLILEARVNPWGWQIKDQSRGGKSFSGKSLGERDLKICDHNSCDLVVCEAFIFRGPKTAKAHIEKVFNYHHKRGSFIMLIYYLKRHIDFDKNWRVYCNDIVPKSTFPKGFKMKSNALKDVTKQFGYNASAIKVGVAKHGKETLLYHIMVNLDYHTN